MNLQRIESPEIAPGQTWEHAIVFSSSLHLDVELDVATAVAFTFERLDRLTLDASGAVTHEAALDLRSGLQAICLGPRIGSERHALRFRVRNGSSAPAVFRANARSLAQPSALQKQLREAAADAPWNPEAKTRPDGAAN